MDQIKGKWKWKETFFKDEIPAVAQSVKIDIKFESNGQVFNSLTVFSSAVSTNPIGIKYDNIDVRSLRVITDDYDYSEYYVEVNFNEAYRIMDFGATPQSAGALYEYLVANAEPYFTTTSEKLVYIAENQQKIYDAGRQAEYDAFWDAVQQNGNRTDYANAFIWWGCEDLNPKYKIVPTYGSNAARGVIYRNANLKRLYSKDFDLSQLPNPSSVSVDYTFSLCSSLEVVEDIGLPAVKTLQYSFASNPALKQVDVIRVAVETNVTDLLYNCPELITVNIEGTIGQSGINLRHSRKLSRVSIESFINALSDTASGKSITFSKEAADTAFPCWMDGVNYGCGGNGEWLELIAPKVENGKWIIDLV